MRGVTTGRTVHYVDGSDHRAAIVVDVVDRDKAMVNLWLPPTKPGQEGRVEQARFSSKLFPGTWHWVERVE